MQETKIAGSIPGSERPPWRRVQQPTPVFTPGESHGQRGLLGYGPQGGKESDRTEATDTCARGILGDGSAMERRARRMWDAGQESGMWDRVGLASLRCNI